MANQSAGPALGAISTSLVATLAFAMTVSPETASENLSRWLRVVGDPGGAVAVAAVVAGFTIAVWFIITVTREMNRPVECG